MNVSEYITYDGLALGQLLRQGEVSPRDLLECAITIASQVNPKLNALCYPRFDAARADADNATLKGTFGALPFLFKDVGLSSTLLPTSVGSRLLAGTHSEIDSTLATRFLKMGFMPFARTTVPEFGMAPTTEAIQNGGPTRNPWDITRSSGGSSGGAAVAVATGIVPIAHGSDGGGSIRIPASCCGLFGLKPSRGMVPCGPMRGEGWGSLTIDGVLTRTVRDTAATMDGIAGMEPGAPYASPARPASYLTSLEDPFPRPLRIIKWREAWNDIAVAPECVAAVNHAEALLTSLGHEVVELPLPQIEFSQFIESMVNVMAASVRLSVNAILQTRPGINLSEMLEPAILDAYRIGESISAETYGQAINRFHAIGYQMEAYMTGYDYSLTPTLTQLPAKLGYLSMDDDFRSFRRKIANYTTFLAIVNASGQPSANVPLYWTEASLPVGVQLIGHFGDEGGLLRLAASLEQVAPWHNRRPVI